MSNILELLAVIVMQEPVDSPIDQLNCSKILSKTSIRSSGFLFHLFLKDDIKIRTNLQRNSFIVLFEGLSYVLHQK